MEEYKGMIMEHNTEKLINELQPYKICEYLNKFYIRTQNNEYYRYQIIPSHKLKSIGGYAFIEFPNKFYLLDSENKKYIQLSENYDIYNMFIKITDEVEIPGYYPPFIISDDMMISDRNYYDKNDKGRRNEILVKLTNIKHINTDRLTELKISGYNGFPILADWKHIYYPILENNGSFTIPILNFKPSFEYIINNYVINKLAKKSTDREDLPKLFDNKSNNIKIITDDMITYTLSDDDDFGYEDDTDILTDPLDADNYKWDLLESEDIYYKNTIMRVFEFIHNEDILYNVRISALDECLEELQLFENIIMFSIFNNKFEHLTEFILSFDDEEITDIYKQCIKNIITTRVKSDSQIVDILNTALNILDSKTVD